MTCSIPGYYSIEYNIVVSWADNLPWFSVTRDQPEFSKGKKINASTTRDSCNLFHSLITITVF